MNHPAIVLASSSPHRKSLLERLGLPFACAAPGIDETPKANEGPESLAARLAQGKAKALAGTFGNHLIIGSDQTALVGLPLIKTVDLLQRHGVEILN